jgi:hypothetical protein
MSRYFSALAKYQLQALRDLGQFPLKCALYCTLLQDSHDSPTHPASERRHCRLQSSRTHPPAGQGRSYGGGGDDRIRHPLCHPGYIQALSGHAVYTDLWDPRPDNAMAHIELSRRADAFLIAPASTNCCSSWPTA